MTVERENSRRKTYLSTIRALGSRGGVVGRVVEEFLQVVKEGKACLDFRESMPFGKIGRREDGRAIIFLPSNYSRKIAEEEAVRILGDTLSITRGLPGPKLHEIEDLKEKMRKELS